jgi:hypothetical protein
MTEYEILTLVIACLSALISVYAINGQRKMSVSHLSRSCFGTEVGGIIDRPSQIFDRLVDA